jgi:ATP-dependent Lon protease
MDEKNLKAILIKDEYGHISTILHELEDKIITNSKILYYSRTSAMKMLNDVLIKLNDEYKKELKKMNINTNLLSYSLYSNIHNDILSENSSVASCDYSEETASYNSSEDEDEDDEDEDSLPSNSRNFKKNKHVNTKESEKNVCIENEDINIEEYKKYNEKMKKLKEENMNYLNEIREIKITNIGNKSVKKTKYEKILSYDPLENIKKDIINLCKIVGFTNIKDIFFLEEGIDNYDRIEDEKYKMLEQIFIPLNYEKEKIKITKNIKNKEIIIKKIKSKNLALINNYCKIDIPYGMKILKLEGYIKCDSLNILVRTSELGNIYLFKKKNKIKNKIEELSQSMSEQNKEFILHFYKNMLIDEILLIDDENINEYITKISKINNEVKNINFSKLIKFFTKDVDESLENIFLTIRLLLLGDNDNLSMASLLFNLLKNKKNNANDEQISDIIYDKLNYSNQIKLKKSKAIIQDKIEKLKEITLNEVDIKKQISVSKNMPKNIKKICLEKLEETKSSNNETYKIKMYVDYLMKFPWPSESDDLEFKEISTDIEKSKLFLNNVKQKLDENVYGHKKGKEKIVRIMGKLISSQGSNISPMALFGPPGVGKTRFAQSLANCLGMPFIQITLGGQNDGELLHGHGYTYSSAQPGMIIKKMTNIDSSRCIMYFDELDKCVSKNGSGNEVMSILTHLIDPMTNGAFQDRFFQEITFPLNKIFFIFSFNDASKIDGALLNRIEKINVESYTTLDKIKIAKDYLLKELMKEIGFKDNQFDFSDEILVNIIEKYTREPGVRGLRRALENILLKLNVDRIFEEKIFAKNKNKKIIITKDIIRDILGEEYLDHKSIPEYDMIGCINGLYCNDYGEGGIIPIQIDGNYLGQKGNSSLTLTGNQKKIMKESVNYSYNIAIKMLAPTDKTIFLKKYPTGLHIHTLDASTPKEGPSAGGAFTLAFLSVMLNLKIRRDVGMTGEIDLNGKIRKIGGLKYKIQGGFKAGLKIIFVPKENDSDIGEISNDYPEILKNVKIYSSDHTEINIDKYKKIYTDKKVNKNKKNIIVEKIIDDDEEINKIIFYDTIYDILKYSLIDFETKKKSIINLITP